jgi:hypothetical protein
LLSLKSKGVILLVLGSIITALGGVIITVGLEARQNAILALDGQLSPFPIDTSKQFVVQLGKTKGNELTDISFTSEQLANGIDMNQVFPAASGVGAPFLMNQLKITFLDNKLKVSTIIKDSDNRTIAEIINNEWKTVNPDTLMYWDRNYNAYAFEIIDSDNIPTFQVLMIGPNRIQIGGLFFTSHGTIYFEPRDDGCILHINQTIADLQIANIQTLMKHPALTNPDNLGKMTEAYYPSSNPLAESTWTILSGITSAIVGPILFSIGFEKYRENSKKAKFHKYLTTNYSRKGSSGNNFYNRRRVKNKEKSK